MTGRRLLIATGVVLSLALAATPVAAAPAVGSSFAGTWVSTDPGDGSTQTLKISAGPRPSVVYQDFYARSCDSNGSPSTHWVSAGQGEVDGDFLAIAYHKSGCGWFTIGGYEDFVVYDPTTDTLSDSEGTPYHRA